MAWLSIDLRFKWVDCELMCQSNAFVGQLIADASDSSHLTSDANELRSKCSFVVPFTRKYFFSFAR